MPSPSPRLMPGPDDGPSIRTTADLMAYLRSTAGNDQSRRSIDESYAGLVKSLFDPESGEGPLTLFKLLSHRKNPAVVAALSDDPTGIILDLAHLALAEAFWRLANGPQVSKGGPSDAPQG